MQNLTTAQILTTKNNGTINPVAVSNRTRANERARAMLHNLEFKPVTVRPTEDHRSNDFVIINSCEGYSVVQGLFDHEGEFEEFWGWSDGEICFYSEEDYQFWARLPSSVRITTDNL